MLSALGARFTVIVTDAEEADDAPPAEVIAELPAVVVPLRDHPTLLAWRKAQAAAREAPGAVVIAADTVVAVDGVALNKPVDETDARAMLRRLAGRSHLVYTGLCVLGAAGDPAGPRAQTGGPGRRRLELVTAEVVFRALDDVEIAAYVATGEPRDKAGAYGVQGLGGGLVREVRGSYTAVVGFPLVAAHRLLSEAGIVGLADPATTYQRWLQNQGKESLPWPPTLP